MDEASHRLIRTTHECLELGISICKPGVEYRAIGKLIQRYTPNPTLTLTLTLSLSLTLILNLTLNLGLPLSLTCMIETLAAQVSSIASAMPGQS